MSARTGTPGLQRKKSPDGTTRAAWVARSDLRKFGYRPNFVKLDHLTEEHLSAECQRPMRCSRGRKSSVQAASVMVRSGSLVSRYENAEDSPYRDLEATTAVTYKQQSSRVARRRVEGRGA
jgi:hypothetical protein